LNSLTLRINHADLSLSFQLFVMKQKCNIKNSFFYLLTRCESNTTGEQAEEDRKAVRQGTHIGIGVDAAMNDVKLFIKRIRRWPFILFVFRLASLRLRLLLMEITLG